MFYISHRVSETGSPIVPDGLHVIFGWWQVFLLGRSLSVTRCLISYRLRLWKEPAVSLGKGCCPAEGFPCALPPLPWRSCGCCLPSWWRLCVLPTESLPVPFFSHRLWGPPLWTQWKKRWLFASLLLPKGFLKILIVQASTHVVVKGGKSLAFFSQPFPTADTPSPNILPAGKAATAFIFPRKCSLVHT